MRKASVCALGFGLLAFSTAAFAIPIFDQIGPDPLVSGAGQPGTVSQNFPDFPTFSSIGIDDFQTLAPFKLTAADAVFVRNPGTVFTPAGATAWTVSIYSLAGGTNPAAAVTGDVQTFNLTPAQMTFTNPAANTFVVSLNLAAANVTLPAGTYWMGVAPTAAFGTAGQGFVLESSLVAAGAVPLNARTINPGNGFGNGTNIQTNPAANLELRLFGDPVPEPTSLAAVGLATLAIVRRRRA